MGHYALKRSGGGTVVTNVEASMCVETMAKSQGGKVIRTRVGDITFRSHQAVWLVFGGEPCGAWVHPKHHFCPDGPLSAALMLKALEEENKTLSQFIPAVPEYITKREKCLAKTNTNTKP